MSIYGRRATEICEIQELREWLERRSAQRLKNLAVGMPRRRGFKISRVATIEWLLEYRPNDVRRARDEDGRDD